MWPECKFLTSIYTVLSEIFLTQLPYCLVHLEIVLFDIHIIFKKAETVTDILKKRKNDCSQLEMLTYCRPVKKGTKYERHRGV